MRKILLLTSILACAAFANPYAKCVACHGAKGEKAFAATPTQIPANLTKAEVATALKGYKYR